MTNTRHLLAIASLAICFQVSAGTYKIADVSYKPTPGHDGESTIVWVRATAEYEGDVDSNDNSWALETELVALGEWSNGIRTGTGVPTSKKIDNEPVSEYGATRKIPDCKVMDEQPNQYFGRAIVAIYHQWWDPETHKGDGQWGSTECNAVPDGDDDGGPDGPGGTGGGPADGPPDTSSPILIDLDRGGFALTDLRDGVLFDVDRDGHRETLSWTSPGSGDGWLALDRNGNGVIDDGGELFGNFTDQPASPAPHGYRALAVFDDALHGGNGNGIIDQGDAIFTSLRVWIDADHDGISRPPELHDLPSAGIRWLETRPVTSRRRDRHGNEFRYQAPVRLHRGMTRSVDVFLLSSDP